MAAQQERLAHLRVVLEEFSKSPNVEIGGTLKKVRASKVLVVGAGGIGCELIKNLVLSGFEHLEVVRRLAEVALQRPYVCFSD